MTDHPAPPPRDADELDQLASDLVDGLLPPDEATRARRDPAIRQRVEQIERARTALRATPPPDPRRTETAIAAALDAFDAFDAEPAAGPGAPPPHAPGDLGAGAPPPPPVPLRPVPSPPQGWPAPSLPARRRGSGRPWLAAAAAVLVGLLAIGILAQRGDDSAEDTAATQEASDAPTAAEPLDEESAERDESGGSGTGAGDAGAAASDQGPAPSDGRTGAGSAVPDLGDVDTADQLAARITTSLSGGGDVPPAAAEEDSTTAAESLTCPGLTTTGDAVRGSSVYVADAVLDGEPVRVHVYQDGTERRLVATTDACTDVVDRPLDG